MCFYVKEIETKEQYRADDNESAFKIIRMLATSFEDALLNIVLIGSEAPDDYSFFKECFKDNKQ